MRLIRGFVVAAIIVTGLLTGCAVTTGPYARPGTPLPRLGDEIVVCGQLFHTGAPVVLWMDAGGYDAYRAECKFTPDRQTPSKPVSDSPTRYSSFRQHVPEEVAERVRTRGWDLPLLQDWVDLFVIHYDVCGTSRRCFEVLHDIRGLSVHFMLDRHHLPDAVCEGASLACRLSQRPQRRDRNRQHGRLSRHGGARPLVRP